MDEDDYEFQSEMNRQREIIWRNQRSGLPGDYQERLEEEIEDFNSAIEHGRTVTLRRGSLLCTRILMTVLASRRATVELQRRRVQLLSEARAARAAMPRTSAVRQFIEVSSSFSTRAAARKRVGRAMLARIERRMRSERCARQPGQRGRAPRSQRSALLREKEMLPSRMSLIRPEML